MIKNNRFYSLIFVLLILSPLMLADTGPKPEMEFSILYEISPAPEIDYAELLMCEQSDCSDAVLLEEAGPQGIWCSDNSECLSRAYGYQGEYFQLVLYFTDEIVLTSNVFTKDHFYSFYDVTVSANDLQVEQVGGRGPTILPDFEQGTSNQSGPGCSLQQ